MTNALDNKSLPIYGDGKNIRDWIYVLDNCSAIETIMEKGKDGEIYNVGGGNEKQNLQITEIILTTLNKCNSLITFVNDRKGHDRRYALNIEKLQNLGWKPQYTFEQAMQETIIWYKDNRWWWEKLKNGEYLKYYKNHYKREL